MSFEEALSGGHPNSLGNTVAVVEEVLKDRKKLDPLFHCYSSKDEVVRLRTSNAFKRVFREQPDWFKPMVTKFFKKIPSLNQASAMWTLSQICLECQNQLSPSQRSRATDIIKDFLVQSDDWIVLNASMKTLAEWAKDDLRLKKWLKVRLKKLATDQRKSVARTAQRLLDQL